MILNIYFLISIHMSQYSKYIQTNAYTEVSPTLHIIYYLLYITLLNQFNQYHSDTADPWFLTGCRTWRAWCEYLQYHTLHTTLFGLAYSFQVGMGKLNIQLTLKTELQAVPWLQKILLILLTWRFTVKFNNAERPIWVYYVNVS